MDPRLGLPSGGDLDHRLDVHPWQLASLGSPGPLDLKARRGCEPEERKKSGTHPHPTRESEISGTTLTASLLGRVIKRN